MPLFVRIIPIGWGTKAHAGGYMHHKLSTLSHSKRTQQLESEYWSRAASDVFSVQCIRLLKISSVQCMCTVYVGISIEQHGQVIMLYTWRESIDNKLDSTHFKSVAILFQQATRHLDVSLKDVGISLAQATWKCLDWTGPHPHVKERRTH